MDRIFISDLHARCILGISDEERRETQDVLINISLAVDLVQPGISDDLHDSVDYRALKKRIVRMVESSNFHLVEALAESTARLCLEDSRVVQAQVTVEKPTALRYARSVGVEITRP